MEKGPIKKTEREYKNPVTVFQAVHAEAKVSATGATVSDEEREEVEREDENISGRSLDKDFLFPLYFAF